MEDFPINDILFIIKVINEKSYVANLSAFIKAVTVVSSYAAAHWFKKGITPNPNPPVTSMSDEEACAALQECADNPETGISIPLILWLSQLLLRLV